MKAIRLQRALARAGVASRRAAETLIREGRVKVNGRVAELGSSVDPERDTIMVGRRRIRPAVPVWICLHKPLGCVVTRRDPQGRPTVFELLPDIPGLTYVGRLDVMTSGVLLLTNQGDAVHRLTHPRFAIERTYRVTVHGQDPEAIRHGLRRPVLIDGREVAMGRWSVRGLGGGRSAVTMVLTEGRHRIVRRLCDALGLQVQSLVRVSHGPIALGALAPGRWRYLSAREIVGVDPPNQL